MSLINNLNLNKLLPCKGCDSSLVYFIKKHVFIIFIFITIIGLFIFIRNNQPKQPVAVEEPIEDLTYVKEIEESQEEAILNFVMIDVKGEVSNPGVYELNYNARVNDVIKLAGGFTDLADQTQINLAQIVADEMVIIVPKEGEELVELVSTTMKNNDETKEIDLNKATQEEFETINGIGPGKASTIIEYREENGPFQQIEDLLNVSGIGNKTFENIQDSIVVK